VTLPPFQKLLDAHAADVYRFLVALVGRTNADDCYQETWLAALRGYPRLRDASNLRGWVLTIAHRKAMDHLRSRRRSPIPVEHLPDRPAPTSETRDYAEISAVMDTTEEAARRNVHEGLKRLRLEYQET
jgi:DNA-directed RNA polymerase specialized sigma24 family protein